MNPQKSFIHSKSRHYLPGGRHRVGAPRTIHMMGTDLPCLPAASEQEDGRTGPEVTESWVKPLMGRGLGPNPDRKDA